MHTSGLPLQSTDPIEAAVFVRDPVMRGRIVRALEADGITRVVSEASRMSQARLSIAMTPTDVVIMASDLDTPDVIGFIDEILVGRPTPIVVIAGPDQGRFAVQALSTGALGAVACPQNDDLGSPAADALRQTVSAAADARAVRRPPIPLATLPDLPFSRAATRIVAVVGGMGAIAGLQSLVGRLPPSVPGVIAQVSLRAEWMQALVDRVERNTVLDVQLAADGMIVSPGNVYLCPGDRQVTTQRTPDGGVTLLVSERLTGRPSADVLLSAVARMGRESVGVVLSGAGIDGAAGLGAMRAAGARTLAESRASCVAYGMPGAAVAQAAAEDVVDLRELPWRILESALVTNVISV